MRSTVVISTLLPLLLHLAPVTATYDKPLTLDRALRKYCLGKYADFIIKYPDPATNLTDIIVFAPTNKAVKEYLLANPDPIPDEPSTSSSKLNKRADPAKNTANKNNVATGASAATAFGSTPPKGSIIATGAGGAAGAKVVKPAGAGGSKRGNDWGRYDDHKDWDKGCAYDYHAYEDAKSIALISAGGGTRTGVKAEGLTFNNGKIVVVDNFFAPAEGTGSYINSPELGYLNKVFYRLPHYKKKIFECSTLTFLAPTADAFHKAGYSEYKSPEWALAKFLDDHTIRNGFIGYTPAFVDGKCYRTASYKGFVTSFDGTKTKINDATIIQEDLIVNNGVIQVIDKVLHSGKKGYYPPEPCKKEWYGN